METERDGLCGECEAILPPGSCDECDLSGMDWSREYKYWECALDYGGILAGYPKRPSNCPLARSHVKKGM